MLGRWFLPMTSTAATLAWTLLLLFPAGGAVAQRSQLQAAHPFCAADELLRERLREDPELRERMERDERALREAIAGRLGRSAKQQSSNPTLVIPVVVYVVHTPGLVVGQNENISDARVLSQIAALNAAFANQGIIFCLATKQGNQALPGLPTPGIIRIANTLTNHFTSQEAALKALLPTLPGDRYLRIWVVKDIDNHSGVAGYARFPGTVPLALDGIVMRYDVFGNALDASCNCSLLPNYDQGKILAHEVGHYLDLYHTFQGGCSGNTTATCATNGDLVCDTPQIAVADTGCPTITVPSCNGAPALLDNELDYTNDVCRNAFTSDQTVRMQAALATFRPLLVSAQNLTYTGVTCMGGLVAAFSADNYNPCKGQPVTLTALNVAGATYAWDFGDGNTQSASTALTATHAYTTSGVYTVILTVSSGSNPVSSPQQVFVVACSPIASSQGNWYFGNKAGLVFASGAPVADLNSAMTASEGCVTQSDPSGSLLFYSDGVSVYNSNHTQMNPGTPLMGNPSNTQSAISVPDPSNPHRYYLFSLGPVDSGHAKLWYTIVDFSNVTTGALVGSNTQVGPTTAVNLSEQITAVPSCNNTGHWIIVHQDGAARFLVFSLTSSGISGPAYYGAVPGTYGSLKASPNGEMLAQSTLGQASGNWVPSSAVYDFDRSTGAITLRSQLAHGSYGCSFSPDSKMLYVSDYSFFSGGLSQTFQYDLTAQNINASAVVAAEIPTGAGAGAGLQLGPDNRIYVSSGSTMLPVINYPNLRDTSQSPNAAGYNLYGPSLHGRNSVLGLPNMIDALPAAQVPANFSDQASSCSSRAFNAPSCASSYAWSFGDGATANVKNPTHTYATNGTYNVTLTLNGSTTVTHTVTIGLPPTAAKISGPGQICQAPGSPPYYNYSVNPQPGLSYSWTVSGGTISGSSTGVAVDVTWSSLPGTVTVTVTDPITGCTATKTLNIVAACPCMAPPATMVDWWTFDETTGTTAGDIAGSFANVGTRVNGPTSVPGLVAGGLSFDGVNDYVQVADHPEVNFGTCVVDAAPPLTIDLWVRTNLPPAKLGASSGLLTLLDKRVNPLHPMGYSLFLYQGRLGFQMDGVNYLAPASGSAYRNIADNQWHLIAVSLPMCRTTARGFLYADGQSLLVLPPGPGFTNAASLNIGRRDPAFGSNYFSGVIDEIEFYHRALQQSELNAIYNAYSGGKCKTCPGCN